LRWKTIAIFVFGFAKSERVNIGPDELKAWRLIAKQLLTTPAYVQAAIEEGKLIKVLCDGKKYRSKQLGAAHSLATDLVSVGMLPKKTIRDLDELCLTPVKPLTPRQIANIRKRERVSQSVFARHLGLSINLISQWERGEKKPSGASLKLLTLVDKKGLDWVA
jgi:putative transcriptional regulator